MNARLKFLTRSFYKTRCKFECISESGIPEKESDKLCHMLMYSLYNLPKMARKGSVYKWWKSPIRIEKIECRRQP